ncbi:hypothetical protein Tsp_12608, partial [Trichinella spiralis]|uniref:hypothetical protein n=1 Tax=Trichinella spiralis TaxID=6334 RepID=UPI0001EFE7A2
NKLSSGKPTGAAAYHHDVYPALFNLRCFREKICITMRYYVCAITDGKLVHCNAINLARGQLYFRSSTPSMNNWLKVAVPLAPHCFRSNCSTNITSSAEFLWCSFSSGHRDKSCSHYFVLNLPSQASQISLSQSSSVRTNPDNVLVLVAVSAFRIYGFCHLMKLVPLATLVHMDIKAFSSRPSVLLLITNSIQITLRQTSSAGARIHVSCGLCRLMKCVTVKTKISIEYQSWHVYKFFIKSSRDRNVPIRSIKVSRVEADIKLRTRKWIA